MMSRMNPARVFIMAVGLCLIAMILHIHQQGMGEMTYLKASVNSEQSRGDSRASIMKVLAASSFPMDSKTGNIKLPDSIKTVMIDIGARDSDYLSVMEERADKDVALILFDPLPDSNIPLSRRVAKYSMRNRDEEYYWLDNTKSRQVFLVRAAMGENEGIVDFNIAEGAACSSILKTSSKNKFWCADVKETIEVPIVTLKDLLKLIPASINQIHVKIDTEGADLAVLRGAGDSIQRVESIVIECNSDGGKKTFRDGECVQSDATTYMKGKGFDTLHVKDQGDLVNILFGNTEYEGPLPTFLLNEELEMKDFYTKLHQNLK